MKGRDERRPARPELLGLRTSTYAFRMVVGLAVGFAIALVWNSLRNGLRQEAKVKEPAGSAIGVRQIGEPEGQDDRKADSAVDLRSSGEAAGHDDSDPETLRAVIRTRPPGLVIVNAASRQVLGPSPIRLEEVSPDLLSQIQARIRGRLTKPDIVAERETAEGTVEILADFRNYIKTLGPAKRKRRAARGRQRLPSRGQGKPRPLRPGKKTDPGATPSKPSFEIEVLDDDDAAFDTVD